MKNYKYKISKENIISRINGLFAYVDFNSNGGYELHRATDSRNGCYGKIIENISLPEEYTVYTSDTDKTVLKKDKVCSYSTLMALYYKCIKVNNENNNSYINFIEEGIGKVMISEDDFPRDVYDLVPDYIFMANAKNEYEKLCNLERICSFYNNKDNELSNSKDLCCKCDNTEGEYIRMGGEKMKNYLKGLIEKSYKIADKFYNYAIVIKQHDDDLIKKIHIDVSFFVPSSINDMGMLDEYLDIWQPCVEYKEGDLVYYNNDTYICTVKNTGYWDNELRKVIFPYNINGDKSNDCFKLIKELNSDNVIKSDNEEMNYYKENNTIEEYYGTKFGNTDISVKGNTDSKLKTIRRYKDYIDTNGTLYVPDEGYDWLYYYKVGYVTNYSTLNDDYGNISFKTTPTKNEICKDLYAYGDVITDIKLGDEESNDKNVIKITYVVGAHLIATCVDIQPDDDGNLLYFYDDFKIDEKDQYHGIKYTDTYYFDEHSEIKTDFFDSNGNIKTDEFNDYVNDINGNNSKKYEFITSQNVNLYEKEINNKTATISSIVSSFSAVNSNVPDYEYNRLFKRECYNGISYSPVKNVEVYIDRGNASALEKHIKLGEVKTLDGMEKYSNGSFFNMESYD